MASFVVVDDALPLAPSHGQAHLASIDTLRDKLLSSTKGKFRNDGNEKSIKIGFLDVNLNAQLPQGGGNKQSSPAIAKAEQQVKRPMGLFKKNKLPDNTNDSSSASKNGVEIIESKDDDASLAGILLCIKDRILKDSRALNIASVVDSPKVRVFPRIYDLGGYRTYSSAFPTSIDEIESSATCNADELKVYFELFLNESGDEWIESDGGQSLIKSLKSSEAKSEVASVSPKRNRLLLISLDDSSMQAVNEIISDGKLRMSLAGCFICKRASKSENIQFPLLMTESKIVPKFYITENDQIQESKSSKQASQRSSWYAPKPQNSSLFITQITLNDLSSSENYLGNKTRVFSVLITATNSNNEVSTVVNAQVQSGQTDVIVFNELTAIPSVSQKEFDSLEVVVKEMGQKRNNNSTNNEIFITIMGFYKVNSSNFEQDSSGNNSEVSDDSENNDEDVDPEEYMKMITTEFAEINDKTSGSGGKSSDNESDDEEEAKDTLDIVKMDELSPEDISFLSSFINSKYLDKDNMNKFQGKFCKSSVLELNQFFCNEIIDEIQELLLSLPKNVTDNSSKSKGSASMVAAGDKKSKKSSLPTFWRQFFDDKNYYSIFCDDISSSASTMSTDDKIGALLLKLSDSLLATKPFAKWIFAMTNVIPAALSSSIRRFRGGDYQLPQSQSLRTGNFNKNGKALCLDACFLKDIEGINKYRKLRREKLSQPTRALMAIDGPVNADLDEGWLDGSYGGYQSYVDVESISSASNAAAAEEEDEDGKEYDEEDKAELLSCPAGFNKLYLVLQDEGVLNYVKYLSHTAPSSRFDINGVYEFFYKKGDDDDDEDDDNSEENENSEESEESEESDNE